MVAGTILAASTTIATVPAGSLCAVTGGAATVVAVSVADGECTAGAVVSKPMFPHTSATEIVVAGAGPSISAGGSTVVAVAVTVCFVGAATMAAGAVFASTVGAAAMRAGPISAKTTDAAAVPAGTIADRTSDFIGVNSRGTSPCANGVISAVLIETMVLRFFASVTDGAAGTAAAIFGCIAIRNPVAVVGHLCRSAAAWHVDTAGVKHRAISACATAQ